jgi:transposase
MKNYALTIGIDVSKAKLDACICPDANSKEATYLVVPNTPKGMASILAQVSKLGAGEDQVLFCLEHTGVYSTPVSLFLQSRGIDYWMVPAIEIKRSKGIRRGKTDKTDARDIAHYALTHTHKRSLTTAPEDALSQLRCLLSEREKLVKAIALFESSREGEGFIPKRVLAAMLRINKKTLTALKKTLKQTDAAIADLVKAHPLMARQYDLATSVPGVGPQSALYFIALTRCFAAFDSWRQLACYAGIAPFEYSSGSSIRGRARVSPLANQKLKSLLTMAALSARRHDPELKAYYQRKISEGKHPMSVMNAIRCKVVARVFAAVRRDSPFVNTQKFATA